MAFPTDAARLNTNGTSAATNKVCSLIGSGGGNPVSGDLLVLILRSAAADTHTTPTNWTQLVLNNADDASLDVTSVWYKVADGAEGATVTVTCTTSLKFTAICWAITGHDSATAPVISAAATSTNNAPDPPSLTPAGGAKDFLWLWIGGWEGEQTSPPTGNPTNYSNPIGADSGTAGATSTNCRCAGASRQLNAASENPPSWLISVSEDWTAWTLAIYPATIQPTRGRISWAEFEVPFQPTRGRVSWAEFEVVFVPTRGRVSWAEFEAPVVATRGRASWMEFQIPAVGGDEPEVIAAGGIRWVSVRTGMRG